MGSTISKQRQIDEMATKVFEGCFTVADGLVRKECPDIHLDYSIELCEALEPTGKRCLVQVKGSTRCKASKGMIGYDFDTKHLVYWLDKCQQMPVFLVLVDVTSEKAYFESVLSWHDMQKDDRRWRKKATKRVKFALANRLDDTSRVRQAIESAIVKLRDKNPGSLEAAAAAESAIAQAKDPRFRVTTNLNNGVKSYEVAPLEPVDLSVTFSGANAVKKLQRIERSGETVSFEGNEFLIEGSKLFEELCGKGAKLEYGGRRIKCQVCLSESENDQEIIRLEARVSRGSKAIALSTSGTRCPLSLNLSAETDQSGLLSRAPCKVNFRLKFDIWKGCTIPAVPFLNQMTTLLELISEGCTFKIGLEHEGNIVATWNGLIPILNGLPQLKRLCSNLKHCSDLLAVSRKRARIPSLDQVLNVDIDDIEIATRLLNGEEVRKPGEHYTMSARFDEQHIPEFVKRAQPETIRMSGMKVVEVFGEAITVGMLHHTYTAARAAVELSTEADDTKGTLVKWKGEPDSDFVIARASEES